MRALSLYRPFPAAVRAHTALRAFTCPMDAILARLPQEGRLLEVGCGHGLFANEAALGSSAREVLGIDPSAEKIRWAAATVGQRANIVFREQRLEDVAETGFDVVAVLDVLYLVPRADWPSFLTACRARLRPGGRFLLKEVDVRPRWKLYRCVAQETLSVRLLGITMGGAFAFEPPERMRELLEGTGFAEVAVTRLDRGYLTPHILYEATGA